MKITTKILMLGLMALAITTTSCTKEGPMGPQGEQGIQGIQGEQGETGQNGADGPTRFSIYTESGSLNNASLTTTEEYQPIGPSLTVVKEHDDSKLEIFFNSNCTGGSFGAGTRGVLFQMRVDELPGNYGNEGSISDSNTEKFISIFDVFTSLSAGTYTVQTYARSAGGISTNVLLDPGGWGGRIIAKETF